MIRLPLQRGLAAATSIGAAFALSSCQEDLEKAGDPPTGEAPTSVTENADGLSLVSGGGRSKHFDAVASHLNLGGNVFGYIDVDGDIEKLADLIQGLKAKMPVGEMPPHLQNLDMVKVLADLGLDGIEAMGMSSYKNGELYHNRAFLYVPGGREGLLKVVGGDAGPFMAKSLAPGDADLVIEQTLNVAAVYEVVSKMVMHFGGEGAFAEFRSEMGEINPRLGLSMADLLGKLDTRLTVVARVHPDKPLEIPDAPVEIPSFDFLVALDDLGWLYDKITGKMRTEMPAEQAAQMFVKGDGFEKIVLPPMPAPDMPVVQPVIHHDIANKRIYMASTQAYLDECLAGKTRLADSEEFKAATAGLPTEGNGLSYVSTGLVQALREIYGEVTESPGATIGAQEAMIISMMTLLPKIDQAQAKVTVNEKQGIFVSSNSTASM